MAKSNGFLMFNDWKPLIDNLSNEQVGDIIKGIYSRVNNEEYEFRKDTEALAAFFLTSIQKNIDKYEETCQKRREAALKQHSKNKQMQANANNSENVFASVGNTRIIQEQEQEKYKNKNKNNISGINEDVGEASSNNPFAKFLQEGLL